MKARRAFNANRWILCDPKVSIAQKLEYFDRVISPKACFAAGHRTIYRSDLRSMDVAYRRFLRSVVGPPRNMDGALPWCRGLQSTLNIACCGWYVINMHPSHLCLHSLSRTDMINPFGVCNCDGGWACVVRTFVFCVLNCNPIEARF